MADFLMTIQQRDSELETLRTIIVSPLIIVPNHSLLYTSQCNNYNTASHTPVAVIYSTLHTQARGPEPPPPQTWNLSSVSASQPQQQVLNDKSDYVGSWGGDVSRWICV